MIGISSLMFFIATWHLIMNAYRMVEGYVDYALAPGGAVAYIGNLVPWHHILKDTLYATQEILGSAAAVSCSFALPSRTDSTPRLDIPLLGALGPQLENHPFPLDVTHGQHRYVSCTSHKLALPSETPIP